MLGISTLISLIYFFCEYIMSALIPIAIGVGGFAVGYITAQQEIISETIENSIIEQFFIKPKLQCSKYNYTNCLYKFRIWNGIIEGSNIPVFNMELIIFGSNPPIVATPVSLNIQGACDM